MTCWNYNVYFYLSSIFLFTVYSLPLSGPPLWGSGERGHFLLHLYNQIFAGAPELCGVGDMQFVQSLAVFNHLVGS